MNTAGMPESALRDGTLDGATDEMKGKLGKVWADANEAVKAAEGNEFVTPEEKRREGRCVREVRANWRNLHKNDHETCQQLL